MLEYLPVVPFTPKDNVIKWYLDMILQMAEDLEIGHICTCRRGHHQQDVDDYVALSREVR